MVFWRAYFPPVLVRTARRLLVEALGDSERGVLVSVTGLPVNADEPERPEICTALRLKPMRILQFEASGSRRVRY